jgi:predicted RNase H-like HicB family nuclease
VLLTKGEDGYYVVHCPTLPGCVTQGRTLDDALKNAREAIALCLEGESDDIAQMASPREVSFHSVSV